MKYIILFFFPVLLFAQHTNVPRNSDIHHFLIRNNTLRGSEIHTSLQYYNAFLSQRDAASNYDTLGRKDKYFAGKLILKYPEFYERDSFSTNRPTYIDSTKTFYTLTDQLSGVDELFASEKAVLKYFYKNPAYFYVVDEKGFMLKVNPIINFGVGRDMGQNTTVFQNTRGIELSGHVDEKIYFYSNILENQASFPTFINSYIQKFRAIPGQGLYKNYNSVILGRNAGYDFLNAQAYVASKITKSVAVEFGHGRNFIGNGYRSLLLSDFSNNNFYLKFNTKIWKLHYQNLFSQLIPLALRDVPGDQVIPRKYSATHYLSFKHKNFEAGIFETVVFARDEGFELQYLNPVILYRLVEHDLRSSDNVLVGANVNWSLFNTFQLYGQFVLDEFKLDELILQRNGPGWWANKYSIQLGAHYFNAFGIDYLDINLEFNRVRPYTYGHWSQGNYAHYNMALAHPLGANFGELAGIIRYSITPKLTVTSTNLWYAQGLDENNLHYGSDITKLTTDRIMNYGNKLLQGNRTDVFYSGNKFSYEVFHNYFLDLNLIYRNQQFETGSPVNNLLIFAGVRINFWEPEVAF